MVTHWRRAPPRLNLPGGLLTDSLSGGEDVGWVVRVPLPFNQHMSNYKPDIVPGPYRSVCRYVALRIPEAFSVLGEALKPMIQLIIRVLLGIVLVPLIWAGFHVFALLLICAELPWFRQTRGRRGAGRVGDR